MFGDSKRKPTEHLPKHEPLATTVKRVIENIGKRTGKPEYETGLEVLDKGIFGLHKSQLTVLAARPGQGKTSMACQIAFNLADSGKKVCFVSLELTRETIIEKMFCLTHKVNSRSLLKNTLTETEKQKLLMFEKIASELPLKIVDDFCFTERELFTLIEHLEMRPDILIVDHIQHIRMEDLRLPERENLNNYLRYLKEIAMKFEIAVLCLSQINRQGEEKPTIANLKGSGCIEEIADHVLLLSVEKPEVILTEARPSEYQVASIDIAKNRFGPVGYFNLNFYGKYGRFENSENTFIPKEKN